jgi:hypothetical protein
MEWIVPVAAFIALGSVALPAQSASLALGPGKGNIVESGAVQQAHYRYYRRYHRYYRRPGVYFYDGPRHHRYWRWRHHRHWY